MLSRRSLILSNPQMLCGGPVLRRENLENSLLAEQVLEAARVEAEAMLARARQEAKRMGEEAQAEARAEVWRQADALLDDWQQQRQQMWEHITTTAENLVGQALQKLEGEQPDSARVRVVLHHLMAARPGEPAGMLYAHPDWLESITFQLQEAQARWTVRADPQLAPDSLCLHTELGDFSLSWSRLVIALWPQPDSEAV